MELALSVIEQTQHGTDDFTDVVVATAFLTGYRQPLPWSQSGPKKQKAPWG